MDAGASEPLVLVLDDDLSVRNSLARLIRSAGFGVRTYSSATEFLEQATPAPVSCVVVDVQMPGLSGLDLQDLLAAAGWTAPIVFITGHGDVPMSVRAMRAGAVNFLQKPFEDEALLAAIREAVERGAQARLKQLRRHEIDHLLQMLTPREREVFELVVAGLPNKKIAARLGTSEKTVKVHRARVMAKMRADSLPDLVRMAQEGELAAGATMPAAAHPGWTLPSPGMTVGPRSRSFLMGAAPLFTEEVPEPSSSPRRDDDWRWSKVRRSTGSGGSS